MERDIDYELECRGLDVTWLSHARGSRQTEGIPDRYARHPRLRIRLWVEVGYGTMQSLLGLGNVFSSIQIQDPAPILRFVASTQHQQ